MESLVRVFSEKYRAGEREIYCVYDLPDEKVYGLGPYRTLILATGYGGSLEENLNCAERYAQAGFAVCSLDFCGGALTSKSSGSTLEMSIRTEERDLLAVFEEVVRKPFVRKDFVCLWGESQGGAVAALCAAVLKERVRALILFYPAFSIFDSVHELCGSPAEIEVFDLWDMPVGRPYFEDIWDTDSEAVYREAAAYEGPVFILHGKADDLVPIRYSERARQVYRNAVYETIEGAGHGFYDETGVMADEKVVAFLRRMDGNDGNARNTEERGDRP